MFRKLPSKSCTVYLVAVLLPLFHLMQTEASTNEEEVTDLESGFQPGIIVLGRGPKHASMEESDYQADFSGTTGPMIEQTFYDMQPSLMCGPNHMRFRASGGSTRHFVLNQDYLLPASCGFTMEGYPRRLVLNVPYDGCNILISDGCYNFPLSWNGFSVTLKCPKPDDDNSTTTTAPTSLPFYPMFPSFPTLAPTTEDSTTEAPQDPTTPQVPPGLLQYHLMYPWLFPTGLPASTTPPQDPVPQSPQAPLPYFPYWHQHTHPLQTTTSASPQDPTSQPPINHIHPYFYLYHMHKMFPYTSQPTSTTPSQDPTSPQPPNYWNILYPYLYYHYHKFPGQPSTTPSQDTTTPSQDPTTQQTLSYCQYLQQMQEMLQCQS